jgi:hypothetical protein
VGGNVHGVVLEGGHYTTYSNFDPVVTRAGNSDEPLGDETVITGTQWMPSQLVSLNQLETLGGVQKSVPVLFGQYRGEDAHQRVYTRVHVSLYASTSSDWEAPVITDIAHIVAGSSGEITVTVTATDDTGVCRVVATYTDGEGTWQSVDLTETGADTWQGNLPSGVVEYFVQVVDEAGNVAVDDNGGSYYQVHDISTDEYNVFPAWATF